MAEPPSSTLSWTAEDSVLLLAFNRPEQMNALNAEVERELHSALQMAVEEPSIRAIVLTGTGSSFSAGYDLSEDAAVNSGQQTVRDVVMRWWNADTTAASRYLSLMRLELPVIAAVNGWCLGGGMWYALCSDMTIASDRAVFGQPEVRENQNSTFLLAALVGWKNAHRYALTGDHFDAEEALRIGVVNEVVPHDQLLERARNLARRIALLPRDSVRLNKMITSLGLEAMGLRNALETAGLVSVALHSGSTDSPDLVELNRVREEQGLRASLKLRDTPFIPEPGGPRSISRDASPHST
ncbi:MAG: enoyl-CoA hydratase/isomerase family protein [Nitrososphaerales archaeon]